MSSVICFNLDQSKILSSGNRLSNVCYRLYYHCSAQNKGHTLKSATIHTGKGLYAEKCIFQLLTMLEGGLTSLYCLHWTRHLTYDKKKKYLHSQVSNIETFGRN